MTLSKKDQLKTKRYRRRKCKVCKEWFRPENENQPICMTAECSIPWAKEKKAKEQKKAARESKQQTLSKQKKRTQDTCNSYVRKRDNLKRLPCISCGYIWISPEIGRKQDAGHYKTVKARSDLRFNEDNIHLQCNLCNVHEGGGLHPGYRPNMIKRIGVERVEILESNNVPRSYSYEDLVEIEAMFKQKEKELDNERA